MRATASKPDAEKPKHPPSIEQVVRKTSAFQHREWIVQRIGWVLLTLLLLAGALGLFGNGPLSHRTLGNQAATFEYERFIRKDADARWEFQLEDGAAGNQVEIAIDAAFARQFEFRSIQPTPVSTVLDGGRWVYRFDARGPAGTAVVFIVQPESLGSHSGTITVNDAAPFTLSQFTYP